MFLDLTIENRHQLIKVLDLHLVSCDTELHAVHHTEQENGWGASTWTGGNHVKSLKLVAAKMHWLHEAWNVWKYETVFLAKSVQNWEKSLNTKEHYFDLGQYVHGSGVLSDLLAWHFMRHFECILELALKIHIKTHWGKGISKSIVGLLCWNGPETEGHWHGHVFRRVLSLFKILLQWCWNNSHGQLVESVARRFCKCLGLAGRHDERVATLHLSWQVVTMLFNAILIRRATVPMFQG